MDMKKAYAEIDQVAKIRRDFEARAEAIRRSDELTPVGKGTALRALAAELNMRLKKFGISNK